MDGRARSANKPRIHKVIFNESGRNLACILKVNKGIASNLNINTKTNIASYQRFN